jgi:hypothetical protein
VTITHGTNRLVSSRMADLVAAAPAEAAVTRPALWDGCAAARLVAALGEPAG